MKWERIAISRSRLIGEEAGLIHGIILGLTAFWVYRGQGIKIMTSGGSYFVVGCMT